MKCEKCGHSIGPEELKCAHCGADNPFAIQHEQNMQQYKKRFDNTGSEVLESAGNMRKLGIKAGVIVFLIVGFIVTFLVEKYNYSDHEYEARERNRNATAKNTEENIAVIDELLEKGEYVESVGFMYESGVMNSGDDAYDELKGFRYVASEYKECMQYMEQIALQGEVTDYYDYLDNYIQGFCMYLEGFYETYDVWKDSRSCARYSPYIYDMEQELRTAMMVYFSMDEDELEDFLALSEAQKAVRLEEVFGHE